MNDQDIAKRVLAELRTQTENVRRDPSEDNYRRAECAIEEAAHSDNIPFVLMLAMILVVVSIVSVVATSIFPTNPKQPQLTPNQASTTYRAPNGWFTGTIQRLWVDHNILEDGRKGMRIHLEFTTHNLLNIECEAAAYFYYSNGTPLRDFNSSYRDVSGDVSHGERFTPPYYDTRYSDFTMFMPYDELHMSQGQHSLKFMVQMYDLATSTKFATSEWSYFTFTS